MLAFDPAAVPKRVGRVEPLELGSAAAARPYRARKPARRAEYGEHAGESGPRAARQVERDRHGNAAGAEYDLARNGAFAGKQVAVLQLYNGEEEPAGTDPFDFVAPTRALAEKGFKVHRWTSVPPAAELARVLKRSSQLWVISSARGAGLGADTGG